MAEQPQRVDPVDRYYRAVQVSELVSNILFWIAAILSIAVLFIEKATYPLLFEIAQIVFALVVIALFVLGLALALLVASGRGCAAKHLNFRLLQRCADA